MAQGPSLHWDGNEQKNKSLRRARIGCLGYRVDPRICGEREYGDPGHAGGHSVLAVFGTFAVAVHAGRKLQSQARYVIRGAGRLPAFLRHKSRPSIFAVSGQYSSTDSIVAAAYARTSFAEDHQRVLAALAFGNIKNDYDDYLGTGVPLRNEAELHSLIARYTYRITGNWFLGGQAIYQDFAIAGQTPFDDQVLDILGIVPYKSAGAGLVVQNDSRDDENMPTRGWLLNFNNMAFRESLGGENDYDLYRVEFKYFIPTAIATCSPCAS